MAELLEGQTLRSLLNVGPLPVRKALEYVMQIASGLAAAHVSARGKTFRFTRRTTPRP